MFAHKHYLFKVFAPTVDNSVAFKLLLCSLANQQPIRANL